MSSSSSKQEEKQTENDDDIRNPTKKKRHFKYPYLQALFSLCELHICVYIKIICIVYDFVNLFQLKNVGNEHVFILHLFHLFVCYFPVLISVFFFVVFLISVLFFFARLIYISVGCVCAYDRCCYVRLMGSLCAAFI